MGSVNEYLSGVPVPAMARVRQRFPDQRLADPAAALRVDFGRPVRVDEAVLYLRADFPHDAWWREGTLHFSDGSSLTLPLAKTDKGQRFPFPAQVTEWVVLDTLIKADDPSPFPALTQLQIWGHDL